MNQTRNHEINNKNGAISEHKNNLLITKELPFFIWLKILFFRKILC